MEEWVCGPSECGNEWRNGCVDRESVNEWRNGCVDRLSVGMS